MLVLVLLLLPLSHSAPPLHSFAPRPPCDTTHCRVSNQSLDSALSTFLCFTTEETSVMGEIDKKQKLAASIVPYLDGFLLEELVAMGNESLVSFVNLVLHVGSDKVVKKTKQQHLKDLINVSSAGNLGLTDNFFISVDPILLALLNCQSKTIAEINERVESKAVEDRQGRDLFGVAEETFYFDFVGYVKAILDEIPSPEPEIDWNSIATILSQDVKDVKKALKAGLKAGTDKWSVLAMDSIASMDE